MRDVVLRAGQRFLVGFPGQSPSPDLKVLIRSFAVGGVVLFARNIDGPEQVAELIRELQSLARDAGHDLPLLIATDQEGGRVARLGAPWTSWPPLRALGASGSEDHARRMGRAVASELLSCGIRCDLAPVVDVDTNPRNPVINDRSFGDDPDLVARLGAAMIDGLQEGGVAACAKHFPGHGDTEVDSHLDLPVVDHARGRLDDVELRPFRKAIEVRVDMIMIGHLLCRELDDTLPASLSPSIVDSLLRQGLGYAGVIVADDLEMKAISKYRSPGAAAALAAKAGCDLLPVSSHPDAQVEAIESVIRVMEAGEVTSSAIDDAELRIKRLKERILLPYRDPDPRQARSAAGTGEAWALASEIAERAGIPVITRSSRWTSD
jgi:beta-N-acetylhexosaminidase